MVTRKEILLASGAALDALAARIHPVIYRSTVFATDFHGNGSCSYQVPKSDERYRAELLDAFDSMGFSITRDDIKYGNAAVLADIGERLGVTVEKSHGKSDEWLRAELLAALDRREGGGPAFGDGGMTLRDYFAAMAMASMLDKHNAQTKLDPGLTADVAYKYADAMLRERAK